MKLDPKGLEAAREQPGTNYEAIIRTYIDAIMPMKVSGLVERLRQYEGRSWETTHCYNGVRDEAAISIENLSIGLATVWRGKLEAEDAIASERAAHAETKRELADHQRATSTVDAHETANVSDKPEGQQEPVAWLTNLGWIDSPSYTVSFEGDKSGCDNFPVYTRPSEQAVTEAMVETEMVRMTVSETIRAMGGNPDEQIIGELTVFDAISVKVRSALKAAMEAGG